MRLRKNRRCLGSFERAKRARRKIKDMSDHSSEATVARRKIEVTQDLSSERSEREEKLNRSLERKKKNGFVSNLPSEREEIGVTAGSFERSD